MSRISTLLLSICLAVAGLFPSKGASVDTADPTAVLQIDVIDEATGATQIELWSLAQLCDLPLQEIRTTTPWTSGPQEFGGVAMADLLDHVGVTEGKVELHAANDYTVSASVAQLRETGAVLAYLRNGGFMSARENGPLWLVWAYDTSSALRTESIYALSVWQLDRMRISR